MGKAVAWAVAFVAGVIVVGWVAASLLHWLLGAVFYLVLGVLVIGGGLYVYARARRALAPGTRTQRRIEAATKTYRQRNR